MFTDICLNFWDFASMDNLKCAPSDRQLNPYARGTCTPRLETSVQRCSCSVYRRVDIKLLVRRSS